jgi:hypothetical protein
MAKNVRTKSEMIKDDAALLLKHVSTFRCDLPMGELRDKLKDLEEEVEGVVVNVNNIFQPIDDSE